MDEKIRAHLFISGKVQGVFFRNNVQEKAKEMRIFGFVSNLPDGRVEAVFEGEKGKVGEMIGWCRRGPGIVERVDVIWEDYTGEFNDFEIKR